MWGAPFVVALAVRRYPDTRLLQVVGALVGGALLVALSRRPAGAAVALCGGFPLAAIILPLLYRAGIPDPLVRAAAYWKELLVGALVLAAVAHRRRFPVGIDRLDVLAGVFVAIVAVYWAFPDWLPSGEVVVPNDARHVAARTLAVPVVAFLAARHAGIGAASVGRLVAAALFAGVLLGAGAVVEIVSSERWDRFLDETLQVDQYEQAILGEEAERTAILSEDPGGEGKVRRAGSWFASPLPAAFALLLPLAAAMHRLAAEPRVRIAVAVAFIGAGLALTQTRSAIVGGVLIVLGSLRNRVDARRQRRVALALGLILGFAALFPLVADTALGNRISGAITGEEDESTPLHTERTERAFERSIEQPLGDGLGSSGGIALRYAVPGHLLPENHYLRVALDIGLLGGTVFLALVVSGARRCRRLAARGGPLVAAVAAGALAATTVVGFLLDSFDTITGAIPLFVFVGAALAVADSAGAATFVSPVSSRTRSRSRSGSGHALC